MSASEAHSDVQSEEFPWQQLDRRLILAAVAVMVGVAFAAAVPTTIAISNNKSLGFALVFVIPGALLLIAAGVLVDFFRWRATRYRLTDQRLEITVHFIYRSHKSLAVERIRTVDLIANPIHRVLGIAVLSIGTGQHQGSGNGSRLKLDALSREEAERLRVLLLRRGDVPVSDETKENPAIATLDWRWIRYALVSFLVPTLGAAAFGIVFKIADWFGWEQGVFRRVLDILNQVPIVIAVLVAFVAIMLIGLVATLVVFVEMWWNYRLERETGTLRVRRGLLTSRSISFEEERIRGVEFVEPVGGRLTKSGRIDAVATGVRQRDDDQKSDYKTLLPAAPAEEAHRVTAEVLREETAPTHAKPLRKHPRAALDRRIRWAIFTVAFLVAVLTIVGIATTTTVLLHIAWITAVVLTPIAIVLAFDAYRNLGHAIVGKYFVVRHGAGRRSTVALQRTGIIGWTVRQSVFQRRANLLTLTATTAAGVGGYSAYDADVHGGLVLADAAVPGLLAPFLERNEISQNIKNEV